MAALSNPIRAKSGTTPNSSGTGILDRFQELVITQASSGVTWHAGNKPFPEMNTSVFNSLPLQNSNTAELTSPVSANDIYNLLLNETNKYTNQRLLRAILFVTGNGGNSGSRPTPGTVFNSTAKAFLNDSYRLNVAPPAQPSGNPITTTPLETLISDLRNAYIAVQDNVVQIQINVCHSSCHNSCHNSRGRR